MDSGRLYNKQQTVVDGTNLSNSATQSYKHVEVANIPVAGSGNLRYSGESDSQTVFSGAGGDGNGGSPEKAPVRWGYVAPSGSRFEVNDTGGAERIDIVHKSGAGAVIEPDGSIYIVSQSKRGAGIAAPVGDIYISAGGEITIKGATALSIQTSGDTDFSVGGSFNLTCQSYNLITQNYNATIDGSSSTNVTNDQSVVVGGIDRLTVAGDKRDQVSGNKIDDVGSNKTARIGGTSSEDVGSDNTISVGGKRTTSVGGDHSIATSGKSNITSSGDNTLYSGGSAFVTASGNVDIKGGGPVKLDGSSVHASPAIDLALWSEESVQAGQATVLAGVLGPKPPVQGAASGSQASVTGPKDAQVMEANDIVDTLTSARKFPQYPGNGVLESANKTGSGMVSHDEVDQAEEVFNEYSGGNQGNINPATSTETFDTLDEQPVNRDPNIASVDVDMEIPAQTDGKAKISKYFTLAMLLNAKESNKIPPDKYQEVVKNMILLANNVLDPVKEKFPDIEITSVYRRPKKGSMNHPTGRAVDFVVETRSMTKHAEIARFARDNLPVDQVFLERNDSGNTHVHLRVSQKGQKTSPKVMTCGDKRCRSKVPGIQVEWLTRGK